MSPANPPTIIRNAKDDEYGSLGRFHASAFASDPMIQLISSKVDPEEKVQRIWIRGAKTAIAKGHDTMLVTERTDSAEIIGLAWYTKVNQDNPPTYPKTFAKGLNVVEYEKKEKRVYEWEQGLLSKYGEYLCMYRSSSRNVGTT